MGEKEEKGIKKIRKRVQQRIQEQEKERETQKEAARKEKENKEKAEQIYKNWLKKHGAKACASTHVIWNWYKEFISSRIFKEIADAMGENGEICISKIISCSIPWKDLLIYRRKEEQMLVVDNSRNLFVHNCVKYGKSYKICGREDLLKHVELPVLIEIAETITDETIWDIVDFH